MAIVVLSVMGLILGFGLAFAADVFHVEVDERLTMVEELLPGYNCGACGYPGCGGFAEGIMDGQVKKLGDCKPGKPSHYNAIIEYLKDHPNKDGSIIKVEK